MSRSATSGPGYPPPQPLPHASFHTPLPQPHQQMSNEAAWGSGPSARTVRQPTRMQTIDLSSAHPEQEPFAGDHSMQAPYSYTGQGEVRTQAHAYPPPYSPNSMGQDASGRSRGSHGSTHQGAATAGSYLAPSSYAYAGGSGAGPSMSRSSSAQSRGYSSDGVDGPGSGYGNQRDLELKATPAWKKGGNDGEEQADPDVDDLDEEERELLRKGLVDWQGMRSWRFWFRKEWIIYYIALIIISVLVILMTIYHKQIVAWLKPAANWMKNLPAGWVIPIAIMFVISFPPLFGHEIVAILCGLVWGLWIGFGIVAAGTFLGEVGNFYAFRYCLRGRAEKLERKNMNYALLAHVVRVGGFKIALLARLSAIPGHFTTAVFSTCGMGIFVFMLAAILSLPKQLIVVYLGVALESTNATTSTKIAQDVMLVVSFLITLGAAWYIYAQMNKAKLAVFRQQKRNMPKPDSRHPMDLEMKLADKDDAALPILAQAERDSIIRPAGARDSGLSYQNAFTVRYREQEVMSVYDVDSPTHHRAGSGQLIQTAEEDLGQQRLLSESSPVHLTEFPSPHPAAPPTESVNRLPSDASTLRDGERYGYAPPDPQEFPVPKPSYGRS